MDDKKVISEINHEGIYKSVYRIPIFFALKNTITVNNRGKVNPFTLKIQLNKTKILKSYFVKEKQKTKEFFGKEI